jgi:hypothetical protein
LLLGELAWVELLVLPMMNKAYPGITFLERQQIFIQFVRYWLGVLEKFKPDMIFFNTTPHAPLYFTLYGISKSLNIKTIMFDLTWVAERITWMNDFREGSILLRDSYLELRKRELKIEDLPLDIREHYERHLDPSVDTTPKYFTTGISAGRLPKKIARKINNIFQSFLNPKIFFEKLRRFFIYLPYTIKKNSYYLRHNLPREYNSLQVVPDLNRKFVYVPLHYQPECTTNPIGEIFQDQIFLIETLSDSLPPDWVIYVKEHPGQWPIYGIEFSEDRYRSYYKRIASIPKVFLIPIEIPSLRLISKAQTVATVSGTAGWESILRGKPALVFGHAWYQFAPGAIRVKNSIDCRKALDQIMKGYQISKNDTLAYLLALDKSSLKGYIDNLSRQVSELTPEQNMKNFLDAFLSIFR